MQRKNIRLKKMSTYSKCVTFCTSVNNMQFFFLCITVTSLIIAWAGINVVAPHSTMSTLSVYMSCPASQSPRGEALWRHWWISYSIRPLSLMNWCQVGSMNRSKHVKYEAAHWSHHALWMFDCQSNRVLSGRNKMLLPVLACDLYVIMSVRLSI